MLALGTDHISLELEKRIIWKILNLLPYVRRKVSLDVEIFS